MATLVIGGGGYLGSAITEYLEKLGQVVVSKTAKTKNYELFFEAFRTALFNKDVERSSLLLRENAISNVIFAAGVSSQKCALEPVLAHEINVMWPSVLYEAAKRSAVSKFIVLSTVHVFKQTTDFAYEDLVKKEDSNTHTYGASHNMCEKLLAGKSVPGTPVFILRLSNVFGLAPEFDNAKNLFLNSFMLAILEGRKAEIKDGKAVRSILSITIFKQIIETILKSNAHSKFNLINCGTECFYYIDDISQALALLSIDQQVAIKTPQVSKKNQIDRLLALVDPVLIDPVLMLRQEYARFLSPE